MSTCITTPKINGQTGSGGGGSVAGAVRTLWVLPTDLDVAPGAIFPVVDPVIDVQIPIGTMANAGDTLVGEFSGWLQNSGAAGAQFNLFGLLAPTAGVVVAVAEWGGLTVLIPNDTLLYPWEATVRITRRTVNTYVTTGSLTLTNFSDAINGRGTWTLANFGGPMNGAEPNPACNWAATQQFRVQQTYPIAGLIWRYKTGTITLYPAP